MKHGRPLLLVVGFVVGSYYALSALTMSAMALFNALMLLACGLSMFKAWHTTLGLKAMRLWFLARLGLHLEVPVVGSPPRLRDYLGPSVAFLSRTFALAWFFWTLFYMVIWYERSPCHESHHTDSFWENLLTNATTFCLILFYFKLSAPRDRNIASWEFRRVLIAGWLFLILAFTTYEFLAIFREHVILHNVHDTTKSFRVAYGLAQGLAIFLIVGRLESVNIRDHIEVNGGLVLLWGYKLLLIAGYAYAAMQPLYPAFDESPEWVLVVLVYAALVGKLCFLVLMHFLCVPFPAADPSRSFRAVVRFILLSTEREKGLSSIEHHLYETERFTVEELSQFEHEFRSRHFGHMARQRAQAHTSPEADHGRYYPAVLNTTGIEYSYLNDFKREHLGLARPHLHGGIWVKRVYPSAAAKAGMRVGDYVTHIEGVPLGRNNRLSALLRGLERKDPVHVSWLSLKRDEEGPGKAPDYAERKERLLGVDERPDRYYRDHTGAALECKYLFNSPDHGVVCRWVMGEKPFTITGIYHHPMKQFFIIPDVHMLRMLLREMRPHDQVTLYGEGLEPRPEADGTVVARPAAGKPGTQVDCRLLAPKDPASTAQDTEVTRPPG